MVEYRTGSQSSYLHLPKIGAFITRALGCEELFQGSLNLYAPVPVTFPDPARVRCGAEDWLFVPVVLSERFVGLAARRPPPDSSEFIEVFACQKLASALGLKNHDQVTVRLLPGKYLALAA